MMEADRRRIALALADYELGGEIGRGAWGVVHAGRHRRLGRNVAVKQLPTAFGADPAMRARFSREARLVASLDHPHIVPVYDYIERDGLFLIVMEHVPGGTLWARFTGRGMAADEAVAVMLAVCAALGHAHDHRILHRDVKPDNLLLAPGGVPKLADFGIAKLLDSSRTPLTVAGTVIGTPAYMAPEQAQGTPVSAATDLYAVGVMLYELLAGGLPFPETADPVAQLYHHVHDQPVPLAEAAPAAPPELGDVVMRALSKRPPDRHASAEDLGVALARAATATWGPGWVGSTAVRVMDHGPIMAATQQPVGGRAAAAAAAPSTMIVRGTGLDHPVLTPLSRGGTEPAPTDDVAGLAGDVAAGLGPPAVRSPRRSPSIRGEPQVLAPLPRSRLPGRAGRPGRRRLYGAAALLVGLVIVVGLVVLLRP